MKMTATAIFLVLILGALWTGSALAGTLTQSWIFDPPNTNKPFRSAVTVYTDTTGCYAYIGCDNQTLYAINVKGANKGTEAWTFVDGNLIRSRIGLYGTSPVDGTGGVLYFTGFNGNKSYVYAVNRTTHTLVSGWTTPQVGSTAVAPTPAAWADDIFVGSDTGELKRLAKSNGALRSSLAISNRTVKSSPAVPPDPAGGVVIFGANDGKLNAVVADGSDPSRLTPKWSTPGADVTAVDSSPTVDYHFGFVYIGLTTTTGGALIKVNLSNGSIVWRINTTGAIESSPWLEINNWGDPADDVVYVTTRDGRILGFNADGSASLNFYAGTGITFSASPVAAKRDNGAYKYVYAGSDQGTLYAVNVNNAADFHTAVLAAGQAIGSGSISGTGDDDVIVVGCEDSTVRAYYLK